MMKIRFRGLVLVLALAASWACKGKELAPSASAAAPAVPGLAPELTPVVPPQVVAGGLPVTGGVRSVEGVAGAIQPTGTPVTAATALGAGNIVQVLWNGTHYQGQVQTLNADGTVRIHYVGWSNGWDENVPRDRLKIGPIVAVAGATAPPQVNLPPPPAAAAPPANAGAGTPIDANTPLTVGQAISVQWNSSWYPSSVVAVNADGTVRIHYVGWADSWDENVPRTRIKLP